MQRTSFIAAATAVAAAGMLPIRGSAAGLVAGSPGEAEYDLTTPSGTIFGTLTLPPIAGPMPVVLIIAGSGPTDRDGNGAILKLDMYKKLASALAGAGVATVRYDKRGVAASHAALASESDIRFGMLVDDAVGWIGKMRDDPRFSRIVIAGHSEGSLIGMIAAQRSAPAAFVSLEGIGFPAADVLRTQLTPRLAAYPELSKQTASIIGDLAAGKAVPQSDVPPALEALFRPSVQPYLISLFKYDPRVEIAKLTVPMTIVQGTHDVQVPVDNGRALAAAAPAASLVVIDSMTHVLTDDSATTLADQLQGAYADGARPLDQTLVKTLVATAKPV